MTTTLSQLYSQHYVGYNNRCYCNNIEHICVYARLNLRQTEYFHDCIQLEFVSNEKSISFWPSLGKTSTLARD